jgi:hypothetical protein
MGLIRRLLVPLCIAATVLAFGSSGAAYADTAHVFEPDSSPYGTSFAKWGQIHWNWWLGPPDLATDCTKPQPRREVVLLPAALLSPDPAQFSCSVPATKGMLVPVAGVVFVEGDGLYDTIVASLKDPHGPFEANVADFHDLGVAIDGRPVRQVNAYVARSNVFTLCLAPSLLPDPNGKQCLNAVGASWNLVVKPLPPGKHTIVTTGSTSEGVDQNGFPTGARITFTTTYHITVLRCADDGDRHHRRCDGGRDDDHAGASAL